MWNTKGYPGGSAMFLRNPSKPRAWGREESPARTHRSVSERATLLAVAAIVAVSVGEVARGQYFNPADFPSLGPIPFGGGQFNTDTATAIFNGPGGTFTVQGVVADGVAVFTFDS